MGSSRGRSIMWFRRDLRLDDHPALHAAADEGTDVTPLFVVDPAFAKAGEPRRDHLAGCLRGLDQSLRERSGSGLVVRYGDPADIVPHLAAELDAAVVVVSRDYAPYGRARDERVADRLRADGRMLRGIGSPYAVAPGSVRKGDDTPYAVFTPFAAAWRSVGWEAPSGDADDVRWRGAEAGCVESEPLPPRRDALDGAALPGPGEGPAHDRWVTFLDGALADYATSRDRPDVDGTSRLSAALKWGTIHPRSLLAELDVSGAANESHRAFADELAWRDFYADVLFHQPHTAWKNLNSKMDRLPVDTDAAAKRRFERWTAGTTGFGIVDAGMRQLAATGWMHNRVRMITASFLVKDLHLPWQWGARWFMRSLVDGDIASNNHGWQWAAGTGTDAAPYFRVFNPTTQQERFDPDGDYVGRWVPEPVAPMLDHQEERREALRRLDATK